ncbi:hypothetical protein DEJ23_11070 [Curtobacterium sp. MCSS17_008]|uniref:regulatory protein RecX n=1 Tax=Curtobacterium sp. MCSS17_008 TaxID=2175647 RepID=UPI000DAA2FCE|nr:regulatory protein RecX [Curtobacterium sp. MCSS17_008]PZF56100.1 hypothetical protein DEJ23_11070 [Curtobacterium sp. MCSS17_008]
MTDAHDHDEGLAPVTDLFGARSRRGRRTSERVPDLGPQQLTDTAQPTDAAQSTGAGQPTDAGQSTDAGQFTDASQPTDAGAPDVGPRSGVDEGAWSTRDGDDAAGASSAAIPLRGAQAQAEWLSPVVGDGSGRSVRAEQRGYDAETADATSASVFAIASGDEIDPAEAPRPLDEQRADAERVSMRALGRKGVSESEMRQLLTKQELDAEVVEHEVARLVRVGLLDDVALATDLVDRLHERKGLGRQGVVAELRRRGIDQAAIDAALEAAADDADDEFVRAIELAEKRARQLRGLDRETAERRLSGFLMRKGYGSGVVRVAVQRALDAPPRRSPSGGGTVRFE